ncbi:MAG: hypothetical protein ABFC84_04070 [Veillonellales bacterium]
MENVEFDNANITSEMNLRQFVDTSNESDMQKLTDGNSPNESASNNITSYFGPVYETVEKFTAHPFANIYPDTTQAEYESLLEDMRIHGQYEPIIIFEGQIADGRTRQKAQQELNHPMLANEWLGTPEDLLNYLYAKSQHRNLTSQQRAVVSLQFLEVERELAKQRKGMRTDLAHIVSAVKGRASDITAKKHGTNRIYLGYAEKIQENAKELLEFVKRNEIPITQAKLLAESIDNPEQRLEAVAKYKKDKKSMKAIIRAIKLPDDTSEPKDGKETSDIIPALMLFQNMHLWQDQEVAMKKIQQIAEILNINNREIWYVPDNDKNTTKKILKLVQAFNKKIAKINRFSSDGSPIKNLLK